MGTDTYGRPPTSAFPPLPPVWLPIQQEGCYGSSSESVNSSQLLYKEKGGLF